VKTVEQQAAVLLHRGRERLVRQRTGLVNALRAHLAEFGIIAPQGLRNVGRLIAIVRDEGDACLPDLARQVLRPGQPAAGEDPWHRADHRYGDRRDGYRAKRLPQRARVCGLAWSGAAAEFDRGQDYPNPSSPANPSSVLGSQSAGSGSDSTGPTSPYPAGGNAMGSTSTSGSPTPGHQTECGSAITATGTPQIMTGPTGATRQTSSGTGSNC
jgi:hypothetical protein